MKALSTKLVVWGLAAAGGAAALAVAFGGAAPLGLPESKRFRVVLWQKGMPPLANYNGLAYHFDGKFVQSTDPEHARQFAEYIQTALIPRKRKLPAGASFHAGDRYSGAAYWIPVYHAAVASSLNPNDRASVTQIVIDEYGRVYDLDYSQAGMLKNLWANPLFQVALSAALIASGYGAPAYAAIQAYNMRGRKLTLKNVALGAARSYAVSQCGEACGAAFDFGAGVASGKAADSAAVDAAMGQLTPEQRAYAVQGRVLVKSAT